eukprot:scaffold163665_cov18-Tisochrysis_lutea.AAC.1
MPLDLCELSYAPYNKGGDAAQPRACARVVVLGLGVLHIRPWSGHTDGGIDLRLMDQYLSLFTGRVASGGACDKFDAVGALMMDSPVRTLCAPELTGVCGRRERIDEFHTVGALMMDSPGTQCAVPCCCLSVL